MELGFGLVRLRHNGHSLASMKSSEIVTSIIIVLVICFLCFRTVCFQPEIISHLSKWSKFIIPIRTHLECTFFVCFLPSLFSIYVCVRERELYIVLLPISLVIHFILFFFSLLYWQTKASHTVQDEPISESVTKWLQNVHVSPMMINTLGKVPVYLVDVCDRIPSWCTSRHFI